MGLISMVSGYIFLYLDIHPSDFALRSRFKIKSRPWLNSSPYIRRKYYNGVVVGNPRYMDDLQGAKQGGQAPQEAPQQVATNAPAQGCFFINTRAKRTALRNLP